MDVDLADPVAFCQFEAGIEMVDVAVNAAVGTQPHQVQAAAARFEAVPSALAGRESRKTSPSRIDLRDSRQALIDDASGPEIEMADFGIPHLPVRQADGFAPRIERGMRILRHGARRSRASWPSAWCRPLSPCPRDPAGLRPQPSRMMRTTGRCNNWDFACDSATSSLPVCSTNEFGRRLRIGQFARDCPIWCRDVATSWLAVDARSGSCSAIPRVTSRRFPRENPFDLPDPPGVD